MFMSSNVNKASQPMRMLLLGYVTFHFEEEGKTCSNYIIFLSHYKLQKNIIYMKYS